MPTDHALLAAIMDALAKRGAFQTALTALEGSASTLALEAVKVPDSGIMPCIIAGDMAHKNLVASLAAWDNSMVEAANLAYAYEEPPPPIIDPPPPTGHGGEYGCPPGTVLKSWQFAMVDGGGRPAGVPPWSKGARISAVRFQGIESKGWYAETGICTGQKGDSEDVILSDSIIEESAKWKARVRRIKGTRFVRVTFIRGPEEHDVYGEPIGGQALTDICLLIEDCYSERSGSQVLQIAQRSEDGITTADYVDGGMIVVRRTKIMDHARHGSEGGTGTRPSQALKVFSAQVGPDEAHRTNRILKHYVLFDRIDLDDSMQTLSHGFALIGACYGAVIVGCNAIGGSLTHHSTSMEAIRVESFLPAGSPIPGPLLIENCHFDYDSGSGGPGIALLDSRPVKIVGCTGNLRVQDGTGKTIGMVASSFERNWSPAAQAIVDKIKQAGGAA